MKFKVNWTLDTGDKQYEAGDTVDLKEAEAAQLVASGVLTPAGKVVAADAGGAGGAGGE